MLLKILENAINYYKVPVTMGQPHMLKRCDELPKKEARKTSICETPSATPTSIGDTLSADSRVPEQA